jgi:Flp pilus assembly protein TadD
MREDSASEPSLSGLARNSVPPKRSLLRSPWLLAAAGLAVLAVPVTVVALMRGHGAAAERANGNPPSEVSKLEAAEARRERAGKSAAPRQSNPAASPAGKHAPPKPVATKAKAAKAKPIATEVATNREADKGPKATEREPAEIPWLDIEPVTTKQCKDLVEAPAGAGAYRFSQALETAQRSMVRGQVDAAHDAFCEASLLSEPAPAVLTGLAQVLLVKSDLRGALAAAEQLVAISPTSATAHNLRGDILIRMGKVDAAKLAWTRAAKATTFSQILRSNIARASHQAAKLAMRGGDLARADRMLRRALAMDPSDVIAAAKLAMVLHKNGKDKAARLWLGYAESLDPSHAQVRRVAAALS